MTVKEGTLVTSTQTYKMAKLCPMITSKYYEYLMDDKRNSHMLQAWDLMMGVHDLASCIATLQKALDKKNGVPVPDEADAKFYMDIDE